MSKKEVVMPERTMSQIFVAFLRRYKECIDNGLCLYHSTWIKRLIKIRNCKSYTEDGYEACEKGDEKKCRESKNI